ncbi:hypothetical protein DES53_12074 [Roseimicrobium gellanilyticum]|uniref:Uncharacterized protein n=1 Tax=Roseimicrobium gellanilyticum TaxID=748857 RepID=A0A366H3R1_9BACT|nr:hypothetical protein DES53_12074 [Roseimicrobium gellanilyticum]
MDTTLRTPLSPFRRALRDALIFPADPVVAVVKTPFTTGYHPASLRDE